ncbi:hypothetical protein ASPZODRAFT_133641 [Penicilliopsis zonata CBS 506.65]|uniref:Zn(2)-C6 fungal-type domain-containing protein n=1 Tax=Penicilliopsis zonata CBS 506.65 TaxID=1073090 RepID=A0A1L9SF94_9EURO|nr:hypothetical protein ASPZODRAFT_133641 [Penicilliopsis zonata CBS 506.65]OJJ45773.1 hypothetical protein ASPZODRAFT_133641 [Penicilliopsis zonata CBS 506.65]
MEPSKTSGNNGDSSGRQAKTRKPRPKLSCVLCRQKKLKCNRLQPCDNCIKHNRTYMCHYAGPQGMAKKVSLDIYNNLRDLEARIRQLSTLDGSVQSSLSSTYTQPNIQMSTATLESQSTLPVTSEQQPEKQDGSSGTMLKDQDGTRYINPTHWQAVLDQIAEVKDYLSLYGNTSSPEDIEEETTSFTDISAPSLLFDRSFSTNEAELLAALPARSTVDRLVSFYLNSKEAPLVIIHIPTFTKEYAQFWKDPSDASIGWLALLYSILCASAGLNLFSMSGRADGELAQAFEEYRIRASQCLTLSVYTIPGRYKLEVLIMCAAMETLRSSDAHVGPSVTLSLTTRLAMHSGYHRDPKHYSHISVFEGEMRRRVWMYLTLLDHYISFQAGLPPTTAHAQSDVEEPRNLLDEDLDPLMEVLPPDRPVSERTSILFPVVLNRIQFICAEIAEKVCSVRGVSYGEVMRLDSKLRELHEKIPPMLRSRPLSESIADSPSVIMDRYNVDLMYQKARCDLHRRYLTQHRLDPRYAYSRQECLAAARQVLKMQSEIFQENYSGGQLGYASFFFSSCVIMHFRVAAMVVSLEISCQSRYDLQQNLAVQERNSILETRKQLSYELERSWNVWNQLRGQSKDALRTAEALEIMLKVANNHLQHGTSTDTKSTPEVLTQLDMRSAFALLPTSTDQQQQQLTSPASIIPPPGITPPAAPSYEPSFEVDLMDASFYLGQDPQPLDAPFSNPTDSVDFYQTYWDNLMLLGHDSGSLDS